MNRSTMQVLLTAACSCAIGGLVYAGIEGSKHDFSGQDWAGDDGCGACHAPETENPVPQPPAWDPDADPARRFGVPAMEYRPGAGSLICLRCHDGTIASSTVGAPEKSRFVNRGNPGLFGTGHGVSDHPVGVRYPRTRDYRPMTAVAASRTVQLPEGNVECISCHDPHNESGQDAMLVMSNERSALCLTCHRK